jgi:predicted nucleic acid-binding protein
VTPLRLVETNILVRQIAQDQAFQARLTDQLFDQLAAGEVDGLISMTVLFETAYVLERRYAFSRLEVAEAIRNVTRAGGVRLLEGEHGLLQRTLELYLEIRQLSFADCYRAALCLAHCNGEIYTFEKDFRRVPGITRLEPGE